MTAEENLDPLGEETDAADEGNASDQAPAGPALAASPAAARFASMGNPVPPRVGPAVQLGLGPLMGLGQVAPVGRYAAVCMREAALDSLKNTCLGSGTKVPEEVAAVKAALDAAVGEREDDLIKGLCPPDVLPLLAVQAWRAVDCGVPVGVVANLWPEINAQENAASLSRVLAWRELRISLRLFSRFEAIADGPGLAAFKVWHETQAAASAVAARTGPNVKEPLLRDAIQDNERLLAETLSNVRRLRPVPAPVATPATPKAGEG